MIACICMHSRTRALDNSSTYDTTIQLHAQILHNEKSYLQDAIQGGDNESSPAAQGLLLASQATTIAVMALPLLLLSFSDTGLLFSLLGGLASAVMGFRRGVGGVKCARLCLRLCGLHVCIVASCSSLQPQASRRMLQRYSAAVWALPHSSSHAAAYDDMCRHMCDVIHLGCCPAALQDLV